MARAKKTQTPKPAKAAKPPKSAKSLKAAAPGASRGRRLGLALAALSLGLVGAGAYSLSRLPGEGEVAELARKAPRTTALIEERRREAVEEQRTPRRVQRWMPISDIAPELLACVLASEDARFFIHEGVDVAQIRAALRKDLATHHFARGASTLTQQLAKNLWLSERKSVLRKAEEALLAHRLEEALTKERILELYLNEVEWGDGVYGAEAAARTWFGRSARDLTLAQAALLAAMLPAPRRLSPDRRPPELVSRARHVLDRVADEHLATPAAVELARAELERHPSS